MSDDTIRIPQIERDAHERVIGERDRYRAALLRIAAVSPHSAADGVRRIAIDALFSVTDR